MTLFVVFRTMMYKVFVKSSNRNNTFIYIHIFYYIECNFAYAIANLIEPHELSEDYVVPAPLDKRVVTAVSSAVAEAAIKNGVSRKKADITVGAE